MGLPNHFELIASDGHARTGKLTTPHGLVRTPAFMPVGTAGAMKGVHWRDVREAGSDIVLGNTYHLMLRPGAERIARLGGLHRFMRWKGPIITDSGGFQVMSLSKLRKINDAGVTFQSHIDGSTHVLTPERAVEIQCLLGSDIQMQLDECIALPATPEETRGAVDRSLAWAELCKREFARQLDNGTARPGQALFGIVQGGTDLAIRERSAGALVPMGFDGYAIGGLSVGEQRTAMFDTVTATAAMLPQQRPRYFMGIGDPDGLLGVIERGVDMFDCVLPTRLGRTGSALVPGGKLNLRNARFARDGAPLVEGCGCPACRDFSRAYIRHLITQDEITGLRLLSVHNLHQVIELVAGARRAIVEGRFARFREELAAEAAGAIN